MYVPDEYVAACIEQAGPSPFLTLVRAALDLKACGFGSKSRAALDAWERIGACMVALNGAPLAFNGGLTRDGVPYPVAENAPPADVPDVMERLEQALIAAGLAAPPPPVEPEATARLLCADGPVSIDYHSHVNGEVHLIGRFRTITDAVTYLNDSPLINAKARDAGRYGVNAPHGLGDDSEAVPTAKALGFSVFWSMGSPFYAPPGVAVSGNVSGRGWKAGGASIEEAALRALDTVEP